MTNDDDWTRGLLLVALRNLEDAERFLNNFGMKFIYKKDKNDISNISINIKKSIIKITNMIKRSKSKKIFD